MFRRQREKRAFGRTLFSTFCPPVGLATYYETTQHVPVMKKILIMGALLATTFCGAYAQSTGPTQSAPPTTDGTTKNSGTGNGTNGSATATGASASSGTGAVGANNGTSYGMQATAPAGTTATGSGSGRKKKAKKDS